MGGGLSSLLVGGGDGGGGDGDGALILRFMMRVVLIVGEDLRLWAIKSCQSWCNCMNVCSLRGDRWCESVSCRRVIRRSAICWSYILSKRNRRNFVELHIGEGIQCATWRQMY